MVNDPDPNFTWATLYESIVHGEDSNLNVDHALCAIPGINKATAIEIDRIRRLFAQFKWLSDVVIECHKSQNNMQRTRSVAKDACLAIASLKSNTPAALLPFQSLDPKIDVGDLRRSITSTSEGSRGDECTEPWGPDSWFLKFILSPVGTTTLCWLGPKWSEPIIDFAYAFAKGIEEFVDAWLACPVDTESLGMPIKSAQERAESLRASPEINSPG